MITYNSGISEFSDEAAAIAMAYDALDTSGKAAVRALLEAEAARAAGADAACIPGRELRRYREPASLGSARIPDVDYDIITVPATQEGDFAVCINDDCLEPYVAKGGLAFFDEKSRSALHNGDVCLAYVNGETYCKQYYKDFDGSITLFTVNRELSFLDLYFDRSSKINFSCFGKLILPAPVPLP